MAMATESIPAAPRRAQAWNWVWTALGPFLGLLLVTALFAWLTRDVGTFLTVLNWRTIAVHTVIVGTAALGMTAIMIAGGIDLSVGSVVALVTVVCARVSNGFLLGGASIPGSLPAGLVAGILAGGLCGLFNGLLITRLGVVPFIITLGGLKMFRGLAKWLSASTLVYVADRPWWLARLLATRPEPAWLLLAPGVWLLLGLSLLMALGLRMSLLGRYIYAVGSNEATARLCGIPVERIKLAVYGLAGMAFGLAGVMQFAYLDGTGDPTTADGLELQVIAAVVIGGGSLNGGEGTVLGTLIGCLIMSVLSNGCVLAGIPNASQDVMIGGIIVIAVVVDRLRRGMDG